MQSLLSLIEVLGKTATAQLSGPKAWLASLVIKIIIFFLDYFKAKHDVKKQFEEKLKQYEQATKDTSLTEEKKDEALDNFLK